MFASNTHAFTSETLTIHRFVRKLNEQVSSDLDSSWRSDPRFHHVRDRMPGRMQRMLREHVAKHN